MLALTFGLLVQLTPINVESPGIRMVNLVPKLAVESRLALSVVPSLENDVVAIRTMGRPWGEVKANLAKVLNATWEEKDGRFVLMQTSEQQAADLATRYDCMRGKIAKLKKDFEPHYSATAWTDVQFTQWVNRATKKLDREVKGAARMSEMLWRRRSNPSGRFLARFLHSVTPESLVQVGPSWEGVYFSDVRMALHTPLSFDTSAMLQNLKDENTMLKNSEIRPIESQGLSKTAANSAHWTLSFDEDMGDDLSIMIDFFDAQGKSTDGIYDFGDFSDPSHIEGLRGKSPLTEFAIERFQAAEQLELGYGEEETADVKKRIENSRRLARGVVHSAWEGDNGGPAGLPWRGRLAAVCRGIEEADDGSTV